jgi:predicted DNA binding CopG/RHH family protein
MKATNRKVMPKFKNESEEADWWASRVGREYVKRKSAQAKARGVRFKGSRLVSELNRRRSVQIAIRLSVADLERARKLAGHKGIGYQTLVKILLHEGLKREARRAS